MPNTEKQVTHSWRAHQEFMRAIQRFLAEIRMQDDDVWVGDVCFGSPNQPSIRAPLLSDSATLVGDSVHHAEALAADVTGTLGRALQITRDTLQKLQTEGAVDGTDLARVAEGIDRCGCR